MGRLSSWERRAVQSRQLRPGDAPLPSSGPARGDIWPRWAAACVEAPVCVGIAAVVEHRHGGAQTHAHLRAHVSRQPRHSGRPRAGLGCGRAAVALARRLLVQSEGVAVDLGGRVLWIWVGGWWEEWPQPTHDGRHMPHTTPCPMSMYPMWPPSYWAAGTHQRRRASRAAAPYTTCRPPPTGGGT